MKHAKVTKYTPQPDGTELIQTESYREELNSVREEVRQNLLTTRSTLMADVIRCLEVFTTTDSPDITIEIIKHDGEPARIVKTYTLYKKKL